LATWSVADLARFLEMLTLAISQALQNIKFDQEASVLNEFIRTLLDAL